MSGAILVHVDDQRRWLPALEQGVTLARERRAILVLVAVRRPQPLVWTGAFWAVPYQPGWDRREETAAHARLCAAVAEVPADIACRTRSLCGSTAGTLLKEARSGRYEAVLTASPFLLAKGSWLFARVSRVLSVGCSVEVVAPPRGIPISGLHLPDHQPTARST